MTNNNEKELIKMMTRAITGIENLSEIVDNIQVSVTKLETGQVKLEADVSVIKEDISEIKSEIKLINKKISIIDGGNRHLRARVEILEDKVLPTN
ncbi:MAG TPA: hypothetical protein PKY82_08865 [Pyrinomonadaceae bacterium]|nr:hypothetical protein [Pyrinomonadaceae bacterium]